MYQPVSIAAASAAAAAGALVGAAGAPAPLRTPALSPSSSNHNWKTPLQEMYTHMLGEGLKYVTDPMPGSTTQDLI